MQVITGCVCLFQCVLAGLMVNYRGGGGAVDYIDGLHGCNMTDDEVLFDDVYELCDIIGK